MASKTKRSRPNRIRHRIETECETEAEKEALARRLDRVRQLLTPPGSRGIDNGTMLNAMFDIVEREAVEGAPASRPHMASEGQPLTQSFMRNSGIYTADTTPADSKLFIGEYHALSDLLDGLKTPCSCGMSSHPWVMESVIQKGHVIRLQFRCRRCHQYRRTWSSSRIFSGHYLVNQKLVHSFTCAGMLQTQYIKFSLFAGLGTVKNAYIRQVYNNRGYVDIVSHTAEMSMQAAVEEVQALPHYESDGEWVITDARHDSTANAYHTTVPCLSGSTKKIVGISTISRTEHSVAQTREVACTKNVLPQVLARGLRITEVAHDIQQQVSRYISAELHVINSYDTWHGTKNVAKQMVKISQGRVRDKGTLWFPELVDKRKSIKTHLYWSMNNCECDADHLRSMIDNIPNHYQGEHSGCHSSSPCHMPHYTPSKARLSDPSTIDTLTKTLHTTYIYRNAQEFCRCRDTFSVESFNHMMLTYVPKRIHFSTHTFSMRMCLALLDWNENVNRPCTSQRKVTDLRRPSRRTAMKVLVEKSFRFVDILWASYIAQNRVDLQPLFEEEDDGQEDFIEEGGLVMDYDSDGEDGAEYNRDNGD